MVEQQVVVLEVRGSSPLIYPINSFNLDIIHMKSNKLLNLNFLFRLLKLVSNFSINLFIFNSISTINNIYKISKSINYHIALLDTNSKLSLNNSNNQKTDNLWIKTVHSSAINNKLFKSFKFFINTTSKKLNTNIKMHFISKFSFYGQGLVFNFYNLNKLFSIWKNFYYLLFNIFYFNIKFISFSNSFFKSEILSLNWKVLSKVSSIWKFLKPFIFLKDSQILNYGNTLFKKIKLNQIGTALVLDSLTHRKTLFYLKNHRFFNISIVAPSSYSDYVDFYLYVNSDSIFVQLYIIRYIISIKKISSNLQYENNKNNWFVTSTFLKF